jgi:peroxiredoxin
MVHFIVCRGTSLSVRICFIAIIGFVLLSCVGGCKARSGLNPGELAPYFDLRDLSGKKVSRDDLAGKATVLSFWASWCEPCIRELPALERLNSILASRGGRVISIGIDDSRANLLKVVNSSGITFPVLIDEMGLAKRRYQVKGVPETFLLSRENRIVALASPGASIGNIEVRLTGPREWDERRTVDLIVSALGL